MPSVSLHPLSACTPEAVGRVAEALRGAGAAVSHSMEEYGTVVALVADAGRDTIDMLAALAHGAERQVLAIVAPGLKLGASGVWKLLAAGASDAFGWDEMERPEAAIVERAAHWAAIEATVDSRLVRENLIGRSPAWRGALRNIVGAALFGDAPILLTGETGTGKELAARLIHTLARERRPKGVTPDLVTVDCTTIVRDLAGSELFGHERGAYTGADRARDGAVALAHGGTLFLDEVGELPLALQAQLLRVVQEKAYKRVGGNTWHTSEFRLVCATNRDLVAEVEAGRFRSDLYFRIAGVTCCLPPLRSRGGDIRVLAEHFLGFGIGAGVGAEGALRFTASVSAYLESRAYPGNVRDLRRLVQAVRQRHTGRGPITVGDIPPEERPHAEIGGDECVSGALSPGDAVVSELLPSGAEGAGGWEEAVRVALRRGETLKEIGRAAEEAAIRLTHAETGSVKETASRLGITERALQLRAAARRQESETA